MKISDLKFGDKFTINNDSFPYVYVCCYDRTYRYIDSTERIHRSTTNIEVEPVGSVEQDKKLVWINSSERAPRISDCDSIGYLYILDNNEVRRLYLKTLYEVIDGSQPFLWAPINKAPAPPEPVYKLVKAEFPRDYNKEIYNINRISKGILIGYDNNNALHPYITRNSKDTVINFSELFILAKP